MQARTARIFDTQPSIFNPCPPDCADAVGIQVTRKAIANYREALESHESAPSGRWSDVIAERFLLAEESLIMAILAWPAEGDGFFVTPSDRLRTGMRPRGVLSGDKLYVAVQDRDHATPLGSTSDGHDVMKLVVLDVADVVDLERREGGVA